MSRGNHYIIESSESGHVFGVYVAARGDEAIRIMLRDSGDDQAEADGLVATLVSVPRGRRAIRYAKAIRALGEDQILLTNEGGDELSYADAEHLCSSDEAGVRLEVAT